MVSNLAFRTLLIVSDVMARTRSRTRETYGEIADYKDGVLTHLTPTSYQTFSEGCTDVIGHHDTANFFTLNRSDYEKCLPVTGVRDDGSSSDGSYYNNVAISSAVYSRHLSHNVGSASQADANALVAGTNPGRSDINPFMDITDLVTLPKLIQETGHILSNPRSLLSPRHAANAHLAYSFGWVPLMNDVRDLARLQADIARRTREIKNFYDKGGSTRRKKLASDQHVQRDTVTMLNSTAGLVKCQFDRTTKAEKWGSVRWKPTSIPAWANNSDAIQHEMRKLAFGFTTRNAIAAAWDLVPWSFVLDWFANVSDFIRVNDNHVPCTYFNCCIMRSQRTSTTVTAVQRSPWLSGGDGSLSTVTLERTVVSPGLSLHLPFMGAGRLSILGSLGVQRLKSSWIF